MVRNAVYNAFLNTLTMGTAFPRVPPRSDPWRRTEHVESTTAMLMIIVVGRLSFSVDVSWSPTLQNDWASQDDSTTRRRTASLHHKACELCRNACFSVRANETRKIAEKTS